MAEFTSLRDRQLNRIKFLSGQLTLLEAAANAAVSAGSGYVESYSFNSGDGGQSTKYRRLDEVNNEIRLIYAELDRLYRIVERRGLANLNLRRKGR